MQKPLVTVCVPTYNYGHYISRAISSVLGQSFEDFELLVADDASNDDTAAMVKPFLADPRVRFMPNEVNNGMFANFNRCIDVAEGRYIKFLMADDWLATGFLERMVDVLESNPSVEFATSGGWLVNEHDEVFGEELQRLGDRPVVPRERVIDEYACGYNVIGMPTSTLVRTETLRGLGGFDPEYAPAADVRLWLQVLARSDLGWVPERLSFLRIHQQHTHAWGNDPHESILKVWRSAPAIPGSVVDDTVLRRGLRGWSVNFTVFAVKHVLSGNFTAARGLIDVVKRNVGLTAATFALFAALPQVLRDRVVTMRTRRARRSIVYSPYPHRGRPLAEVAALAAADDASRLPLDQ